MRRVVDPRPLQPPGQTRPLHHQSPATVPSSTSPFSLFQLLSKILYLPSTLKFNRYANEEEDPLQVQDVMLPFLAQVDASVDRDDNGVIMACLDDMDKREGESEQKTELRQIVAEIIADENCLAVV